MGADAHWAFEIAPDPADAAPASGAADQDAELAVDVIILFARTIVELTARLDVAERRIFPNGALWIAWPRRAGHHSELGDTVIRDAVLARATLVDTKVAALDHDWSALKFVWRKESRDRGAAGG